MSDWKLLNLKTKLANLGITPLGGGKYLDNGSGRLLTEKDLESLSKASGAPLPNGRVELTVPTHKTTSICRKCGSGIGFKKLSTGKWIPINEDGITHRCKQR